jgi:hypothetical protein
MKFEFSCEWVKGSKVMTIEDIFPQFYEDGDKTAEKE